MAAASSGSTPAAVVTTATVAVGATSPPSPAAAVRFPTLSSMLADPSVTENALRTAIADVLMQPHFTRPALPPHAVALAGADAKSADRTAAASDAPIVGLPVATAIELIASYATGLVVVRTLVGSGIHGLVDGYGLNAQLSQPGQCIIYTQKQIHASAASARFGDAKGGGDVEAPAVAVAAVAVQVPGAGAPVAANAGACEADDYLLFCDRVNHVVRSVQLNTLRVRIFAGHNREFDSPTGICVDPYDSSILITDSVFNRIQRISDGGRTITVLAGNSASGGIDDDDCDSSPRAGGGGGGGDGYGTSASFDAPHGICCNSVGSYAVIADRYGHRIRRLELRSIEGVSSIVPGSGIAMTPGRVVTIAGNGTAWSSDGSPALTASIHSPRNVVFDRRPRPAAAVSTDGKKATAHDPDSVMFITASDAIRVLDLRADALTTLRTSVTLAPASLHFLSSGHLLVGCRTSHCLYSIETTTGNAVRVLGGGGGTGRKGFRDGVASEAAFDHPSGFVLTTDPSTKREHLILSDGFNHRIRVAELLEM